MDKQAVPQTMIEAVRQFADPQVAHDFFVSMRFPNGVACPTMGCGSAAVAYMPKRRRWYCNECKRQFTAKTGTIFEDSPIGFDKWLPAIWLLASNRNGISSCELSRALGVTQKTAWFMLQRIRLGMESGDFAPFTGTVEVDEAYIGGRWENKPLRVRRALGSGRTAHMDSKTAVLGIVQRGGKVRAWAVASTQKRTLLPALRKSIHHDATVFTDGNSVYTHIDEYFLTHSTVNHEALEYVRGNVHTNTIECFWSVLKRTIGGTYTHVSPRHLDRYLAEQVFRFDERENEDGPRFAKVLRQLDGKRITYRALITKA